MNGLRQNTAVHPANTAAFKIAPRVGFLIKTGKIKATGEGERCFSLFCVYVAVCQRQKNMIERKKYGGVL